VNCQLSRQRSGVRVSPLAHPQDNGLGILAGLPFPDVATPLEAEPSPVSKCGPSISIAPSLSSLDGGSTFALRAPCESPDSFIKKSNREWVKNRIKSGENQFPLLIVLDRLR